MIKTKIWVICIAAALVLFGVVGAALLFSRTGGTVANIFSDGKCVYSVDLSSVDSPYEMTFESGGGKNTVRIEKGRISVSDADCPDRVCVRSGWLSDSAVPIICLPHKFVIKIEKSPSVVDGIDAVSK